MTRLPVLAAFLLLAVSYSAMATEQPDYKVVDTLPGDIEVRHYAAMTLASTRVEGTQSSVGNEAFRRLAGYIFGGNQAEQKIAMTAPVMQQPVESDVYEVSFVMPGDLGDPPVPDDASVTMTMDTDMTVAVLRYRGGWSTKKYQEHLAELTTGLEASTSWAQDGQPIWARYDPPFKPWFMRTNEIMIPVRRASAE